MIAAQLTGHDRCETAGLVVQDTASVLALCRALVDAGDEPDAPLHAFRGDMPRAPFPRRS